MRTLKKKTILDIATLVNGAAGRHADLPVGDTQPSCGKLAVHYTQRAIWPKYALKNKEQTKIMIPLKYNVLRGYVSKARGDLATAMVAECIRWFCE